VYSSPEDWIDVGIREPESERGYFSKLVTTPQSRRCLNLGSYNYLGFGGLNTHCTPLVAKSVMDYPVTSAGSAAELGYNPLIKEVEDVTAKYVGKEAAVVVGMGFATNSTVIPAIAGKGDLIVSDALNHNSIVEGARLSGAKVKAFKHNCVGDLELIFQDAVAGKQRYNKILVIIEGIYSMEGELCCLPEIVEVCKLYGAYVWLDEAHSIGAIGKTGRGVCEELGVDPKDVDIMMGTFTKSFGAAGGYVAGDYETVARVRQFAAGCTDACSMPPAVCTQILSSLRVISGEDGTDIGAKKLRQLRDNSKFFREGLEALGLEVLGHHPSPVMPVMLYQPYKIGDFSRLAFNRKLAVVVVGAPATPVNYPRIRFCVSARTRGRTSPTRSPRLATSRMNSRSSSRLPRPTRGARAASTTRRRRRSRSASSAWPRREPRGPPRWIPRPSWRLAPTEPGSRRCTPEANASATTSAHGLRHPAPSTGTSSRESPRSTRSGTSTRSCSRPLTYWRSPTTR